MSPGGVYPEADVRWPGAGASGADAAVQQAGEAGGELDAGQEPGPARIPDPSATRRPRGEWRGDVRTVGRLPWALLARTTPEEADGPRATVRQDTGHWRPWARGASTPPLTGRRGPRTLLDTPGCLPKDSLGRSVRRSQPYPRS